MTSRRFLRGAGLYVLVVLAVYPVITLAAEALAKAAEAIAEAVS